MKKQKKNQTEKLAKDNLIVSRDTAPGILTDFHKALEELGFVYEGKKGEESIPAPGALDMYKRPRFVTAKYRDFYIREEGTGKNDLVATRISICYDNLQSLPVAEEEKGEPNNRYVVQSYKRTREKYGMPQDLLDFLRLNGFRRSPRSARVHPARLQPARGPKLDSTVIWFERGGFEDEWMGIKIKVQDIRESKSKRVADAQAEARAMDPYGDWNNDCSGD